MYLRATVRALVDIGESGQDRGRVSPSRAMVKIDTVLRDVVTMMVA